MCSLFSSTSPHLPLQAPFRAQHVDLPARFMPHRGQLARLVEYVAIVFRVVVVVAIASGLPGEGARVA